MNSYLINNEKFRIVQESYKEVEFLFHQTQFSTSRITVCAGIFKNVSDLERLWSKISSSIAFNYQSQLNDDFEKWNLYVIYYCRELVSKSLKYKIENDKFSSRKILEDNCENNLTEETINKIIEKHITNTDLITEKLHNNTFEDEYHSDTMIWQLISDSPLLKGDVDKQRILLQQISNSSL